LLLGTSSAVRPELRQLQKEVLADTRSSRGASRLISLATALSNVAAATRQKVVTSSLASDPTCIAEFKRQNVQDASCGGMPTDKDNVLFCGGDDPRFCEVFVDLADASEGSEVWNSVGCNYCPQDDLDDVSTGPTRKKGGPWYWQPDTISFPGEFLRQQGLLDANGDLRVQSFDNAGDMQMTLIAIKGRSAGRFTSFEVKRDNVLKWAPRRQVYQLVADDGRVFTLHMHTGPTQFSQDLLAKNETMSMPAGWSYRCKVLGQVGMQLVSNDGVATIVVDSTGSAYQLTPDSCSSLYSQTDCTQESEETREAHCQAGSDVLARGLPRIT